MPIILLAQVLSAGDVGKIVLAAIAVTSVAIGGLVAVIKILAKRKESEPKEKLPRLMTSGELPREHWEKQFSDLTDELADLQRCFLGLSTQLQRMELHDEAIREDTKAIRQAMHAVNDHLQRIVSNIELARVEMKNRK
jgi:hypothetical protein